MKEVEYQKLSQIEDSMWWFRAMHDLVLTELATAKLPRSARLLDAGCGTGGALRKIAQQFEKLSVAGVDISATAATFAREKTGAEVAVGSVNMLPFNSGSFDAIVSLDVLCHDGVSVRGALSEFQRCLAPEGVLILSLPAYQWMHSGHDRAVSNTRQFTLREVRQAGRAIGFEVDASGYWNSILFPAMVLHRFMSRENSGSDVESFPAWQERLFSGLLHFKSWLRRAGVALPFGGSVWVRFRRKHNR